MSIEDKVKVNKIGKQISESEHKATQNTLNKPTKHLPEASKAVYETYKSSIRTETSAYKPTLQLPSYSEVTPVDLAGSMETVVSWVDAVV